MIKLQDIINELGITPNAFQIATEQLCRLEIGVEFCYNGDDPKILKALNKFDIDLNDTDYIHLSDIKFPITSMNDLKLKILKNKLKDN